MILNNSKLYKSFLIFGFFTVSLILYIIYKIPNADGYELSIYNVFPLYFFFLFIIAYIFAYIVIFKLLSEEKQDFRLFILPFILLFMTNGILLSIENLHGYLLYGRGRGDILYHIGAMKDILLNGYIYKENIYPITHIIGAIISLITNFSLESISVLISVIFWLVFPLSMYYLSSSMITETWKKLLMASFSTLLLFSTLSLSILPSMLSILFFPFILGSYQYKYWKNKRGPEFSILIIILAFFITYMHPITTIFLIILLIVYCLVPYYENTYIVKQKTLNLVLIVGIIFSMWYFSHTSIKVFVLEVYDSLIYGSDTSLTNYYSNLYSKTDLSIYSSIKYMFWNYGHLVILFSIAFIYTCFIIRKYFTKKELSLNNITYVYFQLISFLIALLLLTTNLVEFDILRVCRLATISSILSCGFFLIEIMKSEKRYLLGGFIFVLFLSSFFVFNIYSSPRSSSPNLQMTQMEHNELKWLIENRNETLYVISPTDILINQFYFLGHEESFKHLNQFIVYIFPINFGYDEYNSLHELVGRKVKIYSPFYTTYGKDLEINYMILPPEVWNIASRYNESSVKNDNSVNIIYSNGEYENWLIKK